MYRPICWNYGWNVFLAGKSVAYLKGKPLLFSTRQSIAVISTQYPAFAADQESFDLAYRPCWDAPQDAKVDPSMSFFSATVDLGYCISAGATLAMVPYDEERFGYYVQAAGALPLKVIPILASDIDAAQYLEKFGSYVGCARNEDGAMIFNLAPGGNISNQFGFAGDSGTTLIRNLLRLHEIRCCDAGDANFTSIARASWAEAISNRDNADAVIWHANNYLSGEHVLPSLKWGSVRTDIWAWHSARFLERDHPWTGSRAYIIAEEESGDTETLRLDYVVHVSGGELKDKTKKARHYAARRVL